MDQFNQIDILHTEDNRMTLNAVERKAKASGLSYAGVPTLADLQNILINTRARIYIVDGKFPTFEGDEATFNAGRAVECIRTSAGKEAKILLFSGEMNIADIAKALGNIPFIAKSSQTTAAEIIARIQGILNS